MPVTVGSKAQVCSRLIVGVTCSNPADGMMFFSSVCCVLFRYWPLRRANHSFRGVLLVVCVCDLETSTMRSELGSSATENKGKLQNLPYRKYSDFPLKRKKWLEQLGNSPLLTHRFTRNINTYIFHGSTALEGQGRLTVEVFRSHSDTPHPVGLLWSSDQPVAEISTRKHITIARERHPCLRRDSNP